MNELIKKYVNWIGLSAIVCIPAIAPSFGTEIDFNQLLMDYEKQKKEDQINFENKFVRQRPGRPRRGCHGEKLARDRGQAECLATTLGYVVGSSG